MTTKFDPRIAAYVDADGVFESYAWPGGYPLFYLTDQNTILCPGHATVEHEYSDETVEAADINWEDTDLWCEHGHRIESAYGEDQEAQA